MIYKRKRARMVLLRSGAYGLWWEWGKHYPVLLAFDRYCIAIGLFGWGVGVAMFRNMTPEHRRALLQAWGVIPRPEVSHE